MDTKIEAIQDSFNMIIPEKVESIIRHLCNKIHNIEWSGILFYTYEGSWENKDLKIICEDILPMDIGSSGYTEFNMNPDVISYMTEHDLLDCECGLIHSHHNMAAFFSGTDTSTLEKEGKDRNHFVSLIVNNSGEYVAAITRKVHVKETAFVRSSYNTFDDVEVDLGVQDKIEREYDKIQYVKLNIEKPVVDNNFSEIDDRLKEIKDNKERASKTKYFQPSLFDDYPVTKWDRVDSTTYWNNNKFDKKDDFYMSDKIVSNIDIPEYLVKLTAARLMLSSLTITNIQLFDFDKWAGKLDSIYSKVFEEGYTEEFWIEMFVEFVLFSLVPESLTKKYNCDSEDIGYVLGEKVLEFLEPYSDSQYLNKVKETIKNQLM